jgi:hypothetical protein
MKYEFLDEKNLKKEPFKLKDGIDPATVDWEKEIQELIKLRDGLRSTIQKVHKIFEKRKNGQNENSRNHSSEKLFST